MVLRITTWNVNGIRNPFSYQPWRDKRTFADMFDLLEADIVIFQETKIQRKDLRDDMVLVPGWDCYFSLPKHEKGTLPPIAKDETKSSGKFGVVIYTRQSSCAPIRAEEGLTGILCPPNSETSFRDLPPDQQIGGYPSTIQALEAPNAHDIAADFALLDSEGRCVILEFPAFVLLGLYNPATRDDSRNAFRNSFWNLLDIRVRNLVAQGKRVIVAGDLNVSKSPLDVANCEADLRKAGMTTEEYFSTGVRRIFNQMLDDGTVWGERDPARDKPVLHDICRRFHPERTGMYTHWETKINARPGNYGGRIDFILCSFDMKDWFVDSNIQEGLMGSDHCPVYAVMSDTVKLNEQETPTYDILNPLGMFSNGERLREYSTKDILPTSGRMIPEFNGRRSIKDMFTTKSKKSTTVSSQEANTLPAPQSLDSSISQADDSLTDAPDEVNSRTSSLSQATAMTSGISRGGDSSNRTKPVSSLAAAQSSKGQQSLKGFFKSKTESLPTAKPAENPSTQPPEAAGAPPSEAESALGVTETSVAPTAKRRKLDTTDEQQKGSTNSETCSPGAGDFRDGADDGGSPGFPVYDPIESKESWGKLFARPVAPRCESHAEPCTRMTTRKPGINCGRAFWMCARPLGPTGQKERGTKWRCSTFIWCSEWANGVNE